MSKFIFVIGGVMSSVGKGIATASIGKILQSKGYRVCMVKCDMYVNVDAGTIRPTEHGEVFVGEDGIEADQDLGNYERFTGVPSTRDNYITTGQIYQTVIEKERNLEYGGEDVEVVPDIPNEIIRRIKEAARKNKAQITIIEIGGTVGEYQNLLFLEAARMMRLKSPKDIIFTLVSYLPVPNKVGEMKTKPTQYAARSLNSAGIQADFILARAEKLLDKKRKEKLSIFCSVPVENIISAPDIDSIYEVPLIFEKEELGDKILKKFYLKSSKKDIKDWERLAKEIKLIKREVKIAVVGKYFATGNFVLSDSYISVIEAIKHSCWANGVKPKLIWVDSEKFEENPDAIKKLSNYGGIIVPGGFGGRGVEGIIKAIEYARENKIPFLGLCYGMQIACVEFARNVCQIPGANTTEINPKTKYPVIDIMPEQKKNLKEKNFGATMRLGVYPAVLKENTLARAAYGKKEISERHRHRWEVNPDFIKTLMKKGIIFSGTSPNGRLMEIVELPKNIHPFFVATQFHPEFKSRPLNPHPLFREFVKACLKK
jgi:CTP synthase